MKAETRHRAATLCAATLLAMLGSAAPAAADGLAEASGSYVIQPDSRIRFHVGNVAGSGIDGDFARFSGTFAINGHDIGRSDVDFVLLPASVRTSDKRVEDFLRSDAVFDAANHPKISFHSTQVSRSGENGAKVDGTLTARGRTGKASFDVSVRKRDRRNIAFHVTGRILRSPYGMDVGTPIYSNVVVFDMDLKGARK